MAVVVEVVAAAVATHGEANTRVLDSNKIPVITHFMTVDSWSIQCMAYIDDLEHMDKSIALNNDHSLIT